MGYFHRVNELTRTRMWINNVTPNEAHLAIDAGAIGCTQNPAYVWKMIQNPETRPHVDELINHYKKTITDPDLILEHAQRDLVKEIANIFMPIYQKTNKRLGYVSIQGNPFKEEEDQIIRCGVFNHQASANIMCKVPVIKSAKAAISYLIEQGIAINATEVMSVRQAMDICELASQAKIKNQDIKPIYYSHITGILDEYLVTYVKENHIDINPDILWQAGIAAAKKTYHITKQLNPEVGFIGGGARGLHHFTEMVGADVNITINWKKTAEELIKSDLPVVEAFNRPTPDYIIDELLSKLPAFRKAYMINEITEEEYDDFGPVVLFRSSFEKAWSQARQYIIDLK